MSVLASIPIYFPAAEASTAARVVDVERAARRFVVTAGTTFMLGVMGAIGFAVYANPWGDFGEVGFLDPHHYNDRLVKVKHLDALPPDERPQVLMLGSSSMMCMRGEDIARATGRSAFNANVSGGQTDDHLCLLRHLVYDLDYRPELLVVGLETWTFGPPPDEKPIIPGARRVLVNVPQIFRHHPLGQWYRRLWVKLVDCFSPEHLATGWRMIWREHRPRGGYDPMGVSIMACDGTLIYQDDDPLKLGGIGRSLKELRRVGVTNLLRQIMADKAWGRLERLRYYQFDGLWSPRVQRFEEFLQLCAQEGIKVAFVLTPLHPLGWQMLELRPEHARNVKQMEALITQWEQSFPHIMGTLDASRVEYFGGDPDDFYDEMHCGPENSQRILAHLETFLGAR